MPTTNRLHLNQKTVIWTILITIALLSGAACAQTVDAYSGTAHTVDPNRRHTILKASVRIVMYGPARVVEITNEKGEVVPATSRKQYNGIGTVVNVNGEHRIVTHDHWPTLSAEGYTVQLMDAWGNLLVEMSGSEMGRQLRYRDGGTVVLLTPQAVSDAVEPYTWQTETHAVVGDIVYVARQHPELENVIDVVAAQVETDGLHNGRQTVDLRNLNNDVVIPGDSGGGVWLNGQLVGNMWSTKIHMVADGSGQTMPTTGCIAAELAAEMLTPVTRMTSSDNVVATGGYQIDG